MRGFRRFIYFLYLEEKMGGDISSFHPQTEKYESWYFVFFLPSGGMGFFVSQVAETV